MAGGDGTVGWVLGCLGDLNKQGRFPIPPTGVIPLGTGNDLSRSFGWVCFHMCQRSNILFAKLVSYKSLYSEFHFQGGSFPFNWKSSVKRTLEKVSHGPTARLDRWPLSLWFFIYHGGSTDNNLNNYMVELMF